MATDEINLKPPKPKLAGRRRPGAADFDVLTIVPGRCPGGSGADDPETGSGQKVAPTAVYQGGRSIPMVGWIFCWRFDVLDLKDFGAIDSLSTSLAAPEAYLDNQGLVFGSDAVSIAGGGGKEEKVASAALS